MRNSHKSLLYATVFQIDLCKNDVEIKIEGCHWPVYTRVKEEWNSCMGLEWHFTKYLKDEWVDGDGCDAFRAPPHDFGRYGFFSSFNALGERTVGITSSMFRHPHLMMVAWIQNLMSFSCR